MVSTSNDLAELKTQIEYYLSNANLSRDKFFREQIQTNQQGWVNIAHFLNCNKIKTMKVSGEEIAEACADSEVVEVSKDKLKVKRTGNPELPEMQRKRDSKAGEKEGASKKDQGEDQYDENGKVILVERDFSDPLIVYFKANIKPAEKGEEETKLNWKAVDAAAKEKYKLKFIYARGGTTDGHLALSNLRLKREVLAEMCENPLTIDGIEHTFSEAKDDCLKDFWQDHGNHYNFCVQHRIRAAKKNAKAKMTDQKKESVKRAKASFEIAGQIYLDIGKVKSKSRAILNLSEDGAKLKEKDEAFLKDVIQFHEKYDEKIKDFVHFEVGPHPNYDKTRCFFIVRKDGSKEDFSVSKCILALEAQN